MGETVDEQGLTLTATGDAPPDRNAALRTDDGRTDSAGRAARQTSFRRRVATFAAYARARLGPSVAATVSVLEKVRDRSCAMRRAGERRESANVPTFEEAAETARKEWLRAISCFDQVVDPDLIDYATYSLRAAERKYVYLLKKAREESASAAHTSTR